MSQTKLAMKNGSLSRVSLSAYFPQGTCYFYGYPTGEDASFLNKVPPTTDELVAARALCCAGPEVSVVSFSSTASPQVDYDLLADLDIPEVHSDNLTLLPRNIDINLQGKERNEAIMTALADSVASGSLVMAQPFNDKKVEALYEIPPSLTIWLNDKANMTEFVDTKMMPARFADYESGASFAGDVSLLKRPNLVPCVVKVSSSSAGDGVYICQTIEDVTMAQADTKSISGKILVEQFITPVKNYAVHFGIPSDSSKPIDIIGFNEQLTNDDGEFLGGVISNETFPPVLKKVSDYLQKKVLPKVRAKGWYGVGGFDVIVDKDRNTYLIDGNFRMTGMSAYHFLVANGDIPKPMISFGGEFKGTHREFERAILPYAGKAHEQRKVRLIALSRHDDQWDFNGALMYDDTDDLKRSIHQLLGAGISSPALEVLLDS